MKPVEPPWKAIKEWIPDDETDPRLVQPPEKALSTTSDDYDQSPTWQPEEIPLGDGRTLVLDST